MKRRDLLKQGIALGGLSLGGLSWPSLAFASPTTQRHFVFVWFRGGWDILLGLDPRNPDVFNEEQMAFTRIQTGYDRLPTGFQAPVETGVPGMILGPYIGNLQGKADRLAVIRGINMETLGHAQGMRRFLTGKAPVGLNAKGSSLATVIADLYGAQKPISNLCFGVETYNDGLDIAASGLSVDSLSDLLKLLEEPAGGVLDQQSRQLIDSFIMNNVDASKSVFMANALMAHQSAQDLLDQDLGAHFYFDQPEHSDLRAAFNLTQNSATDSSDPNVRAALAGKALTAGLSRCVSIQINPTSLDTHDDNWQDVHGPIQMGGFDAINSLIDYLDGEDYGDGSSWMDHTTIVGFSEFSRTALLNSRGGRDHALTNAAFLIGSGIKAGVYGASTDIGLGIQAIDLSTGLPDVGGVVLKPEHIHRALLSSIGFQDDVADLRVDPFTAFLL